MTALTHQAVVDTLNRCLTTLKNSTSRYILEANPFLSEGDKDAVAALLEIAGTEEQYADRIIRLIEKIEGIPSPGLPDAMLAELNYLSFPFLLDVVIKHKKREVALYEKRLTGLDDAEARELLTQIAEEHKAHIKKLTDLRQSKYSG